MNPTNRVAGTYSTCSSLGFERGAAASSAHLLSHLPLLEESDREPFCRGLMACLPSQMVAEWDSHKSGTGSPAASVWGQPHYKQSGPLPGCGDVPVHGVQHGGSYSEQESQSSVCL